jgi:hypothetical protein
MFFILYWVSMINDLILWYKIKPSLTILILLPCHQMRIFLQFLIQYLIDSVSTYCQEFITMSNLSLSNQLLWNVFFLLPTIRILLSLNFLISTNKSSHAISKVRIPCTTVYSRIDIQQY